MIKSASLTEGQAKKASSATDVDNDVYRGESSI
jgi:hypothetical protein